MIHAAKGKGSSIPEEKGANNDPRQGAPSRLLADGGENLRALAASSCKRALRIGVACMPWPLLHDTAYATTAAKHFNSVTVEHHMKWAPLMEEDGWVESDKAVQWATEHGMTVRGHVLVWAVTSPAAWLEDLPCGEFS